MTDSDSDSVTLSSEYSSDDEYSSGNDGDYLPNSDSEEYAEEQLEIEMAREMGALRDTLERLKKYFERNSKTFEDAAFLSLLDVGADTLDKYFKQYPEYGF